MCVKKNEKTEQSVGSGLNLLLDQHDLVSDGRTQSCVSKRTTNELGA